MSSHLCQEGNRALIGRLVAVGLCALGSAAGAAIPFSGERIVSTFSFGARSAVAGDIDRDGDLDIVAASSADDSVSWFENAGLVFSERSITNLLDGACDVALADLDEDGDLDVVVAGELEVTIFWFENRLDQAVIPAFLEHDISLIFAFGGWDSVAVADLDRDGDPDIVAAATDGDAVARFENAGGGSFAADVLDAAAGTPSELAIGELSGDGLPDIVAAAHETGDIVWYRNLGNGDFDELAASAAPDGTFAVAIADLDRDGDRDIVGAADAGDEVDWHEHLAGLTFSPLSVAADTEDPRSVAVADLDGDGDLDVLSASRDDDTVAWHENDGSEQFTKRPIFTNANGAVSVHAADLDGDGDLDVISASELDDTIAWYENLSGRATAMYPEAIAVESSVGGGAGVAAGDLDGDGFMDLVASASADTAAGNRVRWYPFGDGGLGQDVAVGAAQFVRSVNGVELHDLDHDGDLDVLTAAPLGGGADALEGDVAWHENLGGTPPVFAHHRVHESARLVRFATAGDLDGDGDLDIVSAVGGESSIFWYENGPLGIFSAPKPAVTAGTVAAVRSVDLGDVDGDGDLDIAFASTGDTEVGWLENQPGAGDPAFVRDDLTDHPFAAPFWVQIGDVNRDGLNDLVATSLSTGRVAWFRNTGDDSDPFDLGADQIGGLQGATGLELADLDQDGDLDFAVTTRNIDRVQWMENPGIEGDSFDLLRRPLPPLVDGPLALAVADLDRDGTLDLAVASEGTVALSWFPNVRAIFWDNFERADLFAWGSQ